MTLEKKNSQKTLTLGALNPPCSKLGYDGLQNLITGEHNGARGRCSGCPGAGAIKQPACSLSRADPVQNLPHLPKARALAEEADPVGTMLPCSRGGLARASWFARLGLSLHQVHLDPCLRNVKGSGEGSSDNAADGA